MADTIRAILIDEDPIVRGEIRDALLSMGDVSIICETDNLVYGYEMVRQHHPELVFLDVRQDNSRGMEILRRIGTYFKDIMVVASGLELDVDTIMHCMQAGAREYLKRPFTQDDVITVYRRHRASLGIHQQGDSSGRIVSIYSNKGGLGKTTIAVNTALAISQSTGESVALVDLNLQLGDISTFLDIKPRQSISDILKNLSRVDEAYLKTSLAQYQTSPEPGAPSLYVLADPIDVEESEDITAEKLATLLAMLKATFSYVVVDMDSLIDPRTITILDQSDLVILVSMMNLPCIRNTQRMLELCKRLGYDRHKVKLVVNRYVPSDEITLEDVEDTLDYEVFWKFPNNYFAVITSINRGVPLRNLDNGKDLYSSFINFTRNLLGISAIGQRSNTPTPAQGTTSVLPNLSQKVKKSNQSSAGGGQEKLPSLWGMIGQTFSKS